jgi:glyoxylase-like metal-dependent hydrolase (beta-lactamase superfamily II)
MSTTETHPPLLDRVLAGERQQEATRVGEGIYLSEDVSSSYLVTTREGNVVINTGLKGGPRHKAFYAKVSAAPLKFIILTQSHIDHIGGIAALREPDTEIIAQKHIHAQLWYQSKLQPFFTRRTHQLWRRFVGDLDGLRDVKPDVLFDDSYAFELGGRRFELYAAPWGETEDSCIVWLPQDRTLFVGNFWGPVYMSVPYFSTIRGDKIRPVYAFLQSLDRIIALKPDLILTGHGERIEGAERIAADLAKLRAAVSWLVEETFAGMNGGKDVHTLMAEIKLPEHLRLREAHGSVRWAVRAIWEQHVGGFHYDATTSLYEVPAARVAPDLIELAGGSGPLVARAHAHIASGKPLEALHLLNVVLAASPDDRDALEANLAAHRLLLSLASGENFSEVSWLESQIQDTEDRVKRLAV